MPEPIDGQYFNWLRAKVIGYEQPSYMYLDLLKVLYGTQFIAVMLADGNRVEDGLELRLHFLTESGIENEQPWFESPCSVFEVLIALANRACFVTDTPVATWFWRFIENLRLDTYRTMTRMDRLLVDRVLETWMYRVYDWSGDGGIFPMTEPTEDQTRLELWIQFNRYIDVQHL